MSKRKSVLILMALLLPAALEGRKPVPKPTLDDLARVWLGGPPKSSLDYYRLQLAREGTGTLIVQYLPQNPPVIYEVVRTRLKDYQISFELRQPRDPAYGIYARGTATSGHLDLKIGGTTLDWKTNVFLEPESAVLGRIQAVTECAKQSATCRTP